MENSGHMMLNTLSRWRPERGKPGELSVGGLTGWIWEPRAYDADHAIKMEAGEGQAR
ncbi:hypothetical protein J6590_039876 [Homalodisca vitripennis]|nr:hypothetical protein J6590_039876 [Homalodisca vitripennis]